MNYSANAVALVKSQESCARSIGNGNFQAYPDPASPNGLPWTIGWGSTGAGITSGTIWTQAQCDADLTNKLNAFAAMLTRMLHGATTTQNQFDALLDFVYNEGPGHLQNSTLLRYHLNGNYDAAQEQFASWVFAGGHKLEDLVRRRAAEAALYGQND